jgi:tRNA threonylcarbamoyladenosine biosynthesis protein TsaB
MTSALSARTLLLVHRAIAIETSGRLGSVAVADSGRVLAEEAFPHGFKHAAGVVAVIDRLTQAQGWKPQDLNEIYISAGPGSFTGLRVGVTVAKTLAFSLGAKLVAVSSAAVLARNAPLGWQNCLIVLDAKRGQIFGARFTQEANHIKEAEPAHLDTLGDMLVRSPRPVYLIGEGIPFHQGAIADDAGILITPEESWRAKASVVAQLGWQMSQAGEFSDAQALTPTYIRRPEAEEKWEARQ